MKPAQVVGIQLHCVAFLAAVAFGADTTPTWEVYARVGSSNQTLPAKDPPHPVAIPLSLAQRNAAFRLGNRVQATDDALDAACDDAPCEWDETATWRALEAGFGGYPLRWVSRAGEAVGSPPSTVPAVTTSTTPASATTTVTTPQVSTTAPSHATTTVTTVPLPPGTTIPPSAFLPAQPHEVNWTLPKTVYRGSGRTGFYCFRGRCPANQYERALMQGALLKAVPQLQRLARRLPDCASVGKRLVTLRTISGTRFFLGTDAYEGRMFWPKLHAWFLSFQGAGDLYAFGRTDPERLQRCILANTKSRARCAAAVTPDLVGVLDALDLHVVDGHCVKGALHTVLPPQPDDDAREQDGLMVGSRMFPPLQGEELAALLFAREMHRMGAARRCDPRLPMPPVSVAEAQGRFESLCGSDPARCLFHHPPDFDGYADDQPHPLDAPGTVYWSAADGCDLGRMTDVVYARWADCVAQGGPWGRCQELARHHAVLHADLNYRCDNCLTAYPQDGVPLDKVPDLTSAQYLAEYRTLGRLP